MKATATSQAVSTPIRHGLAPRPTYLLFTFGAGLFLFPFMRTLVTGSDEGIFLCGAARIVQGQVFARDFFEVMGPGTFYWMAAFFKLFGVTFLAARISLLIPLLGTALLIYFLSRETCQRFQLLPCVLLAGPYFGLLGQVESHHVDSNFFALLSVACLVLWQTTPRNSLVVAAGVLAGLTTCILQPKGVLLVCAFLVWFWLQRRSVSSLPLIMSLITGSFVAVVGLMLAYFWSRGAWGSLVYANYVFPSQHYPSSNAVAYGQGIRETWGFLVTQPDGLKWPVVVAAVLIAPSLLLAALPALLLALGIPYKWRSIKPEVVLLWLSGWAIWASEFHRKDLHHLTYGSPLLVVLFVHLLGEYRWKSVNAVVQILAVCAVCLAGFNWMVAAIAHSIPTRAGSAAVSGPGAVPVLNFLNQHTQPGEDILIYPYSPVYYFLSATTNPTPYSVLLYNFNTPSQYQQVLAIMEQRKIRYVVWDTTVLPRLVNGGLMPGALPSNPGQLIVEPYLESHYTTLQNENGIRLMERKQE